jgi:hypothetical protein
MAFNFKFPKCQTVPTLWKHVFQPDANGDVCMNVCISEPKGDANKCVYAEGVYEAADIGIETCFISCPVPATDTLKLEQIIVSFLGSGQFLIKKNGSTIMRLVTSPAQPTISIKLENPKPIDAGDTVEICFCGPCEGIYSANLIGTQVTN